ncbi:MAG: SAM-dependent methyltransferase [Pseudomonadota bacterium]
MKLIHATPPRAQKGDVVCDTALPFVKSLPLAVSLNALHLANDPVRMLGELRASLRPDGLFLGAAAATGTLSELIDALLTAEAALSGGAAMRVAPFADVRTWGDALRKAGFALPVADEVSVTVRYGALSALFEDLRAMGARGVLATRVPAHKRLFVEAEAIYRERYSDPDGRIRATFRFACLSGWAPDPSQQRPAKPGSANVRLEDALKKFGG